MAWKNKAVDFIRKNADKILLTTGIVGSAGTTVLACHQTVKATKKVIEEESKLNRELTWKEKIKLCWKFYLAPSGTFVAATTSLIFSNSASSRKAAASALAAEMSREALQTYIDKAADIVGEKKANEIREEVAKDDIDRHPLKVDKEELQKTSPEADMLCYESVLGIYFWSNHNDLDAALNALNYRLVSSIDDDVCYREWLAELNLGSKGGDAAYEYSWRNSRDGIVNYIYTYKGDDSDYPCLHISFDPKPRIPVRNYI